MTIRAIEARDREAFLAMQREFYGSDAVLHDIPPEHAERTFALCVEGSPYQDAWLIEDAGGAAAGYGLLALTWSNEAGGLVLWLEELYLRPQYQGQGAGQAFFAHLEEHYRGRCARFRLEVDHGNEGAMRLYRRLGFEELPYVQFVREFSGDDR